MFGELILDIFNGRPWSDGERTLPAVCVVDVLDEDFKIDGRSVVGKAIVMAHAYDDNEMIVGMKKMQLLLSRRVE